MKIKMVLISFFLIFFSCGIDEVCGPDEEWVVQTSHAGGFASSPTIWEVYNGAPNGHWVVRLVSGWDCYTLSPPSENHDWMKVLGHSFQFLSSNKDNVMLGARWLPDQMPDGSVQDECIGILQVTFYLNIDGQRWDPWFPDASDEWHQNPDGSSNWPVIEVSQGDDIEFEYTTSDGFVSMVIRHNGSEYKKTVPHSGIGDYYRRINLWAGGTSKPVSDKVIESTCLSQ